MNYAIGDIQGCSQEFADLLDLINFDPSADKLWLVGDLVNRGPDSLGVLRMVKNLGDAAITVLGNHDLHLLMVAAGCAKHHHSDTLHDILDAPDREELLTWLRYRPLMHAAGDYAMVHAGLLPQWDIAMARKLAAEVEAELQGPNHYSFFTHLYGNKPSRWNDSLEGYDRWRVIVNAMTRMRFCSSDGKMEFSSKGNLPPAGFLPWFDVDGRASAQSTLIVGHWSALGLLLRSNLAALDTGCLWGGSLTALRLEDREVVQLQCKGWAELKLD